MSDGCTPIVKWAGGKNRLLGELIARVPTKFRTYREPFFGGGALFFRLRSLGMATKAVLSDLNPDLMAMYEAVATAPADVLRGLRKMTKAHRLDEKFYYAVRDSWNTNGAHGYAVSRAVQFLYLNKACWNGLWRVNQKGEFNVPRGSWRATRSPFDPDNIRAASEVLRGAALEVADYANALARSRKNDFVYLDPPYDPASESSSFTAYTVGGFGPEDQEQLADRARRAAARGVHVLISNADTPRMRKLYRGTGMKVERIKAPRSISCNGKKRGDVDELLISGGPGGR